MTAPSLIGCVVTSAWAAQTSSGAYVGAIEEMLLLLFAMIRSVVKSFKVPNVEVAAARMSN